MQIDKAQLLQFLRYKGQHDQAHQAQQELPDQVDIDKPADQLSQFGLSPTDLLGQLGGGLDASSPASTNIDNNGSRIAQLDSRAVARALAAAVPLPQEG